MNESNEKRINALTGIELSYCELVGILRDQTTG